MTQAWRWGVVIGTLGLTVLLAQHPVWAATGTGSGFYLEDLSVKIFQMCKNVVIPLLLIGMVIFAAGNIAFGWMQMGPGLGRLLLGGAILAGGIETILLLVGGNVQTALVLP
jgi:hypothetical protein